jgi:predicted ATP-dependent endonuclease of OLD family
MRVINLQIENFKRLKAVEITPDGYLQVIGGENAQGKTSVLDAIWAALAGGTATKEITNPIREGEEKASVRLDMGDIIVTRTWKLDKPSQLQVTSQLGAVFPSPQKMLDELVGRLSMNPLDFLRLTPKQQVNALLDISGCGAQLDALAKEREIAYNKRTEIGRIRTQSQAQVDALGDIELDVERVNLSEAIEAVQDAIAFNNKRKEVLLKRQEVQDDIYNLQQELIHKQNHLALLNKELEMNQLDIDVDSLQTKLDNAESINAACDRNQRRLEFAVDLTDMNNDYEQLNTAINSIDMEKTKLLASANMPVEGLSFNDEGVLFNDIPFIQASSAEQIRVSLGMAMALNPKIKIIRIMDGSLLDANSMKIVYEMAHANDYQVWVERVGDGDSMAVIIEDGEVK